MKTIIIDITLCFVKSTLELIKRKSLPILSNKKIESLAKRGFLIVNPKISGICKLQVMGLFKVTVYMDYFTKIYINDSMKQCQVNFRFLNMQYQN